MNLASAQGFIWVILASEAQTVDEREAYLKQMQDMAVASNEAFDAYAKTVLDEDDRRNFQALTEKRAAYRKIRAEYIALIRAEKRTEAAKLLHESLIPAQLEYAKAGDVLAKYNLREGNESAASIVASTATTLWTMGLISIGAFLVSVALGFAVIRGLNAVLRALGDTLGNGAGQVTAAATQVASSSQSLAQGASEQAASLEETSSSLEEMAGMTNRNAENANKANELARQARQAADTGAGDLQAMSAAMNDIKVSSDDIAKIIKTIDEIAFQTNILALNAAVEAARAGEAGMGFAVVAEEVRALAQRSAQAARETADKIEGAITKTAQGVQITEKVAKSLSEIVDKARLVDQLVAEVSTASREQSQGVQQITIAVSQMDKIVQSNAAGAEEGASAAEELNAQSVALQEAVGELLRLVGARSAGLGHEGKPGSPTASKLLRKRQLVRPVLVHGGNRHASVPLAGGSVPAPVFPNGSPGAAGSFKDL